MAEPRAAPPGRASANPANSSRPAGPVGANRPTPDRRILSIWLPGLMVERWRMARGAVRGADGAALADRPVVLVEETAHGPRIVAATPPAAALGARRGMRLADARALAPSLVAEAHDPAGDRLLLEQMALWAQRWGPWSALDGPDGLVVDIAGTDRLLGGDARISADVARCFAALGRGGQERGDDAGHVAVTGIAATAGAAWALARYGAVAGVPTILPPGADPVPVLSELPVAALRLEPATLAVLRRLGLRRVGEVMALGRSALARRFRHARAPETNPLVRLDQLVGLAPEPLLPVIAAPPLRVEARPPEPLRHRAGLDRLVAELMDDLVRLLEARGVGARRVELAAFRVDGEVLRRRIELAVASRAADHLLRLMERRLETLEAGFGFDCVQLTVGWAEPMATAQAELDAAAERHGTCLAAFVDRIEVKLGPGAISRLAPAPSHWPERAQARLAPLQPFDAPARLPRTAPRPLTLLDPAEPIIVVYETPEGMPRRFRWRGQVHDIARVEGPERIAPEWWRERSTARLRDYYRVEVGTGARYWIYRRGLFGDGRGGAPDWFLHGLFG